MSRRRVYPHAGLEHRLGAGLLSLGLSPTLTLAVAFSGGIDSLALAIAIARMAPTFDIQPVLIHVDHGLRPGSAQDAARCAEIASDIGLQLIVHTLPAGLSERAGGVGIEDQARRERYLALAQHCLELNAQYLLTGHHMDDQAETVLMHLFRGSGIRGAAGMREFTRVEVPWWSEPGINDQLRFRGVLWRPFLFERKRDLESYVRAAGLDPIHDESNDSGLFLRNVVRNDILPLIEAHWPGSVGALSRFATAASLDDDVLTDVATDSTRAALTKDGALLIVILGGHHPAIATRIVSDWLEIAGVVEPTWERTMAVLDLADEGSESTILEVGNNRCVVRFGESLRVGLFDELIGYALGSVPGPVQRPDCDDNSIRTDYDASSFTARGNDWTLRGSLSHEPAATELPATDSMSIRVSKDLAVADLEVRQVRAGDRWLSTGAAVRESLRKAGVHPLARDSVVCVASGKTVFFVPNIQQPNRNRDQDMEPAAWLNLQWTAFDRAS